MTTRPNYLLMPSLAAILGLIMVASPAAAQAQTYQTWQNPDATSAQPPAGAPAGDDRLKAMVERLNTLVGQAEKDRAADPKFLKDIRSLISEFDNPWSRLVLFDDFADGDFTQKPAWTIGAGRYWIEKNWGLRNGLDEVKAADSATTSKNATTQLLGQILNQALGGKSSTSSSAQPAGIQPTSIFSAVPLPNAFSIELDFSSWVNQGEFIIGPYQGQDQLSGYRLSYTVGKGLALRITSPSGTRTIAIEPGPFALEDKKAHTLQWTRTKEGDMRVTLDGKKVFDLRDVSFRDAFNGFGMATRGGDFIVKRVSILTTP